MTESNEAKLEAVQEFYASNPMGWSDLSSPIPQTITLAELARDGYDPLKPLLREMLQSQDELVMAHALRALSNWEDVPDPELVRAVLSSCSHPSSFVRSAALQNIHACWAGLAGIEDKVLHMLESDNWPPTRVQAYNAALRLHGVPASLIFDEHDRFVAGEQPSLGDLRELVLKFKESSGARGQASALIKRLFQLSEQQVREWEAGHLEGEVPGVGLVLLRASLEWLRIEFDVCGVEEVTANGLLMACCQANAAPVHSRMAVVDDRLVVVVDYPWSPFGTSDLEQAIQEALDLRSRALKRLSSGEDVS